MPLLLLVLGIGVAVMALASSSSSSPAPPAPGPPPLPPVPQPGVHSVDGLIHQGIVYELSWIDPSNATDPLVESAAIITAGWMPQEPLKGPAVLHPLGLDGQPTGQAVNGWTVHALRIGPTIPATPESNAGLLEPLILVEMAGPDLPPQ